MVQIRYSDILNYQFLKMKKKQSGDYLFVGCFFIGLGIGIFFHNPAVGVMMGLGTGFIAKYVASIDNADDEKES